MFSPLYVCLSVCEQDISERRELIRTKLCGQVGVVPRTKRLDFGEDLDPDPDTLIKKKKKIVYLVEARVRANTQRTERGA